MTQLELFSIPPSQAHSATSRAAAEAIEPQAGNLRQDVLEALRLCPGGLTDQEIQDALSMPAHTECPRRIELVRAGLVVDSGEVRKTKSGRNAVVWRAK